MNDLRHGRVFVTGGTGFVGPWMIEGLLQAGAEVVALVRDRNRRSRFFTDRLHTKVSIVYGDVTDAGLLRRALAEYEITHVVHLASQAIVGVSRIDPASTFASNITGAWNLLEACRQMKSIEGVLIASSDKAYGKPESLPCTEKTPLRGLHPYDVSKSCMDLIAQSYQATFDLPVVIARCANLFGGGDFNTNRLVPGTILSVLRKQPVVLRSDGSPVRDYLYVQDGVTGMLRMLARAREEGIRGEAFNLSLNTQKTVLELVTAILSLMGETRIAPQILGCAEGESDRLFIDSTKAKRILDWQPVFSLEDGLFAAIDWYKENWE